MYGLSAHGQTMKTIAPLFRPHHGLDGLLIKKIKHEIRDQKQIPMLIVFQIKRLNGFSDRYRRTGASTGTFPQHPGKRFRCITGMTKIQFFRAG